MAKKRNTEEDSCVIKLQCFPEKENARIIDGQSKICNWLSNRLLERANTLKSEWKEHGNADVARILYSKRGLRDFLPSLKADKPFLKSVHSSPLKNTALRLSKSIRAYQDSRKGKRKGKAVGWPKFKSFKREFFSLEYDEPFKGYHVLDCMLELSLGLGEKRKQHRIKIPMPDSKLIKNRNVKNLRMTKENGAYFAIFTVTKIMPAKKAVKTVIALDPNHKNLAYGVDNQGNAIEIETPHWLKNFDKRFDELKSKRDKCKKRSVLVEVKDEHGNVVKRNWQASRRHQKYQRAFERAQAKRREQIKTFCFTVANALCKRYDLIGIGDYTPHGGGLNSKMRRAMNNRSTIGTFKKTLRWCGQKSGKVINEWQERGSTKTCHACLHSVPEGIPPNIREWTCENCAAHHIRDENSSITGLRRMSVAEKNPGYLGVVPSSGLALVKERWAWRVLPSGVHLTPRGKGSFLVSDRQEIKRKDRETSIQTDQDCSEFVQN